MKYSDVIIIGGGPAGSMCAWKLKQAGMDCIILDSAEFPRTKLCAGWIPPDISKLLQLKRYPHKMITFRKIHFNILGFKIISKTLQYSIRRFEFDHWLLKRSKAEVYRHKVKELKQTSNEYIIDGKYRCKYIVGAGGTHCPVYRKFFRKQNPRSIGSLVLAMEEEFKYDYKDANCHLWFFENKLPGYAWYVPKGNNYINIGIGGFVSKTGSGTIKEQWIYFTKKLAKLSLIKGHKFKPRGYVYYVNNKSIKWHQGNAFIIGDSAGLATQDLAEGIGPAVRSGMLAAKSIITGKRYSLKHISKNSESFFNASLIKLGIRITRFLVRKKG